MGFSLPKQSQRSRSILKFLKGFTGAVASTILLCEDLKNCKPVDMSWKHQMGILWRPCTDFADLDGHLDQKIDTVLIVSLNNCTALSQSLHHLHAASVWSRRKAIQFPKRKLLRLHGSWTGIALFLYDLHTAYVSLCLACRQVPIQEIAGRP